MDKKFNIGSITPERRAECRDKAKLELQRRIDAFDTSNLKYGQTFKYTPSRYKKLWLDCFDKIATPKERMKLKCLECSNYQIEEVKHCPIRACALWNWRPYQEK